MQVIADVGADAFYSGSVAEDLIKDIREAGVAALASIHCRLLGEMLSDTRDERMKMKLMMWFFKVGLWIWRI